MLLYLDRQAENRYTDVIEKGEVSVVSHHFHVFTVSEMNRVKCGYVLCVCLCVCEAGLPFLVHCTVYPADVVWSTGVTSAWPFVRLFALGA